MSLTEEIYQELIEGLEKGLDWQQVLAKHGASKGPLYNAAGRVIAEIPARLTTINEAMKQGQAKLDELGQRLDELDQKMKTADEALQAKSEELIQLEERERS